jgi:hypothetical protein
MRNKLRICRLTLALPPSQDDEQRQREDQEVEWILDKEASNVCGFVIFLCEQEHAPHSWSGRSHQYPLLGW